MSTSTNPLYPSILAPLDGVIQAIPRTELCKDVILRNLEPTEISTINQQDLSGNKNFGFGLGALPSEIVCLEAKLPSQKQGKNQDDGWDYHQNYVRNIGGNLIRRGITLLRLTQGGPIGARLAIVPLTQTVPYGYTLAQIEYIPPIRRPKYPQSYVINSNTLKDIRRLFEEHWHKDLESEPGIRWLNKAYFELNNDDRLAHLVFGLEQLLLKGERERSYLSFKMALRGAWLLEPPSQSRVQRFRQLRTGYNLRSDLAHGNLMRELTDEELELTTELEDALRRLMQLYLKDPERFRLEVLNLVTLGVSEGLTEDPGA
jgi:hypothetical protein